MAAGPAMRGIPSGTTPKSSGRPLFSSATGSVSSRAAMMKRISPPAIWKSLSPIPIETKIALPSRRKRRATMPPVSVACVAIRLRFSAGTSLPSARNIAARPMGSIATKRGMKHCRNFVRRSMVGHAAGLASKGNPPCSRDPSSDDLALSVKHPTTDLYGLTPSELGSLLQSWGFSPVHAARIWNLLYLGLEGSIGAMAEVPPRLRARLAAEARIGSLPVSLETDSSDGYTRKYLLGLDDGERIETVLMRFTGRATACLSSQAGCAMGC